MTEEYIRTIKGKIINRTKLNQSVALEDIMIKTKRLIELIEVDDYVNGHKVILVDEENELIYCDTKGYEAVIHSKDIKEILTKELYLDNCYNM